MENHNDLEMKNQIENKLGFNIKEYNDQPLEGDIYECDNKPNPFDVLSIEELLFLRKHNYFLS